MAKGYASIQRRYELDRAIPELTIGAAHRLLAGVHPKIVAAEHGMSIRTAYRWRRGLRAAETVTIDGWTATFARFAGRPPVRISAWERAA